MSKINHDQIRNVMYAILFNLDDASLKREYSGNLNDAFAEIWLRLTDDGFAWLSDHTYSGAEHITASACVDATQRLAHELPWFSAYVRDLRIQNDFEPPTAP